MEDKERLQAILGNQKDIMSKSFEEFMKLVMSKTETLNLVQREQFRLFMGFCFFIVKPPTPSRNRTPSPKLPPQITDFHTRLFPDIEKLNPFQIKTRWSEFASESFVHELTKLAQDNTELSLIVDFIKTSPSGGNYLTFLLEHEENLKGVNLNPSYLWFLPKFEQKDNLISDDEFNQIQLQGRFS